MERPRRLMTSGAKVLSLWVPEGPLGVCVGYCAGGESVLMVSRKVKGGRCRGFSLGKK